MDILAIGNSYTVDANHYLYSIAKEQGLELDIYTLYIGGCSLEQHATNLKDNTQEYRLFHNGIDTAFFTSIKEAILSRCWDVITIQQCSMCSYKKESYFPYLTELTDFIRKNQPLARYILHETWGYGDGSAPLNDRTEFKSFEEMSEAVAKTYRNIYDEIEFEGFIPDEATDGMDAVAKCKINDYDIILMDVMMPKLDGFSAVKEIRKFKGIIP